MDQMNPTPAPQPTIQPVPATSMKKNDEGGAGPVIGIVVIAIIIVLGGAYYLLKVAPTATPQTLPTLQDAQASNDPDVQATLTQGSSDSLTDIQADLNTTDLTAVDQAAAGIDTSVAAQ